MRQLRSIVAFAVALAAPLLAPSPASAEWTDWIGEAELDFGFDSNLNNAVFDSEEEYDLIWRPEARVGRVYQLEGNTRLQVAAVIRGEIHHRWTRDNSVAGEGQLAVMHKFGVGDAPWGKVFFNGGYEGVRDSERGGGRLQTGLQIGKRFSPRFDASLGYEFTARWGDDGAMLAIPTNLDVWDQKDHNVSIDGRFLVTENLTASAGYEFRHGDLYANAQSNRMAVMMAGDVKAVAMDRIFGGWAYRVNGNAHTPFARLNYRINDHWAIDATYEYRYAESRKLDYQNHRAQLAVLFRY
jgi:hypothetical protein